MHQFLVTKFAAKDVSRSTFNLCFDIPFLIIAENSELQRRFFDTELDGSDEWEEV